ncbi:MAG: hypothetical protein LWW85_06225 [Marinilabiliales bacterium]|nr:hypothetical protein [Marinilabiliales bacterium]
MKNRTIYLTLFLLIIAISNYQFIRKEGENARLVENLTVFAIGLLVGILILQIARMIHDYKKLKGK